MVAPACTVKFADSPKIFPPELRHEFQGWREVGSDGAASSVGGRAHAEIELYDRPGRIIADPFV